MKSLLLIAGAALALSAHAGTLTPIDLSGDSTADAYLESGSGVLWDASGNANGLMLYGPAKTFVEGATIGTVAGWRLPTIDELKSLYATLNAVPIGTLAGPMAAGPFTDIQAGYYWSTTSTGSTQYALDTRTGTFLNSYTPSGTPLYAWAVHSPVPEPTVVALLLVAIPVLVLALRRRSQSLARAQLRHFAQAPLTAPTF